MLKIQVGGHAFGTPIHGYATVDDADSWAKAFNWGRHTSGKNKTPYVGRSQTRYQGCDTIILGREIMSRIANRKLEKRERIYHVDGNWLNCTRANLTFQDPKCRERKMTACASA